MPTFETPTEEELEAQSSLLQASLTAAAAAVAATVTAQAGVSTSAAFAATTAIPSLWAAELTKRALRQLTRAYVDAATTVIDLVRPRLSRLSDPTGLDVDVDAAARYVLEVRSRLVPLGESMKQAAQRVIADASQSEDSPQALITSATTAIAPTTARLAQVARDEVRAATHAGARAQVEAVSRRARVRCTWRSHHDERTRPWHRAADGQEIGIGDAFHVGDSWLLAPSIPAPGRSFDVGDICNCRCRVVYELDIITETNSVGTPQEAQMSELQPGEASLVAAAAKWNPSAHPRGKDGKFIEKGALSTLLSTHKPNLIHVGQGVNALDQAQWNNLTDEQKTYIKDSVAKIPASSEMYKTAKTKLDSLEKTASPATTTSPTPPVKVIPAHKGALPGSPAKVSTALAWGKYDDGDVILESGDGQKRVAWNGKVKKYATQFKAADGTWKTEKLESKKDFYAGAKGSTDWVVPGKTQSSSTTSTPALAPAPVSFIPSTSMTDAPSVNAAPAPATPSPSPSPTPSPNAPSSYTLNPGILATDLLDKIIDKAPPNSVIAWHKVGIVGSVARASKNSDGQLIYEKMDADGTWKTETSTTSNDLIFMMLTTNVWKLNPDLVPNADKPTGDAVTDWQNHLGQSFVKNDVVATHESGLARIAYAGETSLGMTYDLQKLNTSTGKWKSESYESNLLDSYFTDGMLTSTYQGSWIASEPSTPKLTEATLAPGGVPLDYDSHQDVITSWSSWLLTKKHTPGNVVALHESGKLRLIAAKPNAFGMPKYTAQAWDNATKKWVGGDNDTLDPTQAKMYGMVSGSDWLAPKPDGKPYPVKSTATSTPTATPTPTVTPVATPTTADTLDTMPGGQALIYTLGNVASSVHDVLQMPNVAPKSVALIRSDGKTRIIFEGIKSTPNGETPTYTFEKWDPTTKKWMKTSLGAPSDPTQAATAAKYQATGDIKWLKPLPGGKAYQAYAPVNMAPPIDYSPTPGATSTPTPTPSVSPLAPASSPLGTGGDIAGVPWHVKSSMKSVLKAQNVGYWSKPEKIWDAAKQIQKNYPDPNKPGHSLYSSLQVFKSLDSTLKTSDPSPYETKMVKWAALPKGQAYIKNSVSLATSTATLTPGASMPSAPSVPSTSSTPTSTKFPDISSNFSYPAAWANGKPVNSYGVMALVNKAQHLDVIAVHVKGSVQHRIIRSTDDPETGLPRFYVQMRDDSGTTGWDVVVKPNMVDDGLMLSASELDTFFPGMKFRSAHGAAVAVTPAPTSTATAVPAPPSTNVGSATDDISHLTATQKDEIFKKFKSHSGTYLSSPQLSVFNALKNTATLHNLSVMQVLKTVDEVGAKNAGVANGQLFEKKISDWLTTKQGTLAVGGKGMSKIFAQQVPYSPGISANGVLSFEESSKLKYKNMSVSAAHAFEKEVLKQGKLPDAQTNALNVYTGGVYSSINSYLYGGSDQLSASNLNIAKNVQKAMRPSDQPILLHRGVYFDGIANSTGHEDLESKVGQTWLSGGFFSTSVGSHAAFSGKPVAIEIEAPPGTPMAWMERLITTPSGAKKPLTKYPGENEMLLAAGLSYRIVSVEKVNGKSVVRLRVVPPSEEVTV